MPGEAIGKEEPLVCAAGTLKRFSSLAPPQSGQAGRSSPRNNSSKSDRHAWQVYS
jgi:hypothetical protein